MTIRIPNIEFQTATGDGSASREILYHLEEGIATITINRPDQLNALSKAARAQLFEAWAQFENDPEAHVAILTGAGSRAFCVGRDLKEPEDGPFDLHSIPLIGSSVQVSKPTIAAVNGLALGGGFLFAQMCDLCIAAETASFSIPEVRLGRGAAWAAPLVNLIPPRVVMEMLLTGVPIPAARLHALGFVNSLVPAGDLLAVARAMAAAIVANAPLSVKACRQLVRGAFEANATGHTPAQAEALFRPVYDSDDAQEGARAFQQKRKPLWKGR